MFPETLFSHLESPCFLGCSPLLFFFPLHLVKLALPRLSLNTSVLLTYPLQLSVFVFLPPSSVLLYLETEFLGNAFGTLSYTFVLGCCGGQGFEMLFLLFGGSAVELAVEFAVGVDQHAAELHEQLARRAVMVRGLRVNSAPGFLEQLLRRVVAILDWRLHGIHEQRGCGGLLLEVGSGQRRNWTRFDAQDELR